MTLRAGAAIGALPAPSNGAQSRARPGREPLLDLRPQDHSVTPHEVAQWVAWHAEQPTDGIEQAVEHKIMPALRGGELTATGWEDCKAPSKAVPKKEVWADAELEILEKEDPKRRRGGQVSLKNEQWRGVIWDHILFSKYDVLRLWPAVKIERVQQDHAAMEPRQTADGQQIEKHKPGRKRKYPWDEYGAAFGAWLNDQFRLRLPASKRPP